MAGYSIYLGCHPEAIRAMAKIVFYAGQTSE